jgi:hypothetical protein
MDREKQKELVRRRRLDKKRRKRAKKSYILWSWSDHGFDSVEAFHSWAEERANRECDIRTPCSCSMCGNPRKHFNELTMQEKRGEDQMNDEIENLNEPE